jgi:very-short-patch-repair endonuclease
MIMARGPLSEETKRKISESLKGKTGRKHSEETKKKMAELAKKRHEENPDANLEKLKKANETRLAKPVSDETRAKISEANKRRFQDPSERAKVTHEWTDEERAAASVERSKRWENPEYREKIISANTGKKRSQSTKSKIADKAKERWANPEFKNKMIPINKAAVQKRDMSGPNNGMHGRNHTKETKRKQSAIAKKRIQENPDIIKNMCAAFKEKWWNDKEFHAKMMHHLNNITSPTSIEIKVGEILKEIGINYISQKVMGPYIVDFYLPDAKIVIECDGDYWHNLPKLKARDERKDRWLNSHGQKVIRIWEHEINEDAFLAVTNALDKFQAD